MKEIQSALIKVLGEPLSVLNSFVHWKYHGFRLCECLKAGVQEKGKRLIFTISQPK